MPRVTLSVPSEKLPLFKDLLNVLGIKDKKDKSQRLLSRYRTNVSSTVKDTCNSFVKKHFSWEYYRNELEFE